MRFNHLLVLIFATSACSAPNINHGNTPGGNGSGGSAGSGGGAGGSGSGGSGGSGGGGSLGDGGDGSTGCVDSAKLVYVIDQSGMFSSFLPNNANPPASTFTDINKLSCVTGIGSVGASPFSMSVDRTGTAWVEYQTLSGSAMYKVSTTDASCTATGYMPSGMITEFGMGFVTDSVGGTTDTLYVAGGGSVGKGQMYLGTFDVNALTTKVVANITGQPELTGNANAELFGFFPDENKGDNMARISQIDKMAGTESNTISLESQLGGKTAQAWAFAFYGGDFWVFLQKQGESATTVYYVNGQSGMVTSFPTNGRSIVGAGVSTCAPVVPIT